jgi:hypothetical protein
MRKEILFFEISRLIIFRDIDSYSEGLRKNF